MAKYSSPNMLVYVDNSVGALVDQTAYVKTIGGFAPVAETGEITTFGDAWREHQMTIKSGGEFTLEGDYDDTATTGPNAIQNCIGDTRSIRIYWAGSGAGQPKTEMEAICLKYERTAAVGALQGYKSTWKVTGAVTEGTI